MALRPFDLIHKSLNRVVTVKMKNGASFTGRMLSYDENLNLFLEDARELEVGGREFKSLVLKGGNIVCISPVE
ncbi:MAG: small nuclear ribonucleoprotein [Methanobacteriota archaeon]|nr:MAG: small nuclear ribonucleoprotein [Euryarchaeota archaeon]